MKLSTLLTILKPLNAKLSKNINPNSIKISEFKIDSRKVNTGDCFIPLKGKNTDGHNYIKNAFENNAICSLAHINKANKCPEDSLCILIDQDPYEALLLIAKYKHKKYIKEKTIAITGSAGKTTTKYMLAHILKSKFEVYFTPGNLNGDIGTPLALANLNHTFDFAILEFGTAKFGEINLQKRIAPPDISVLLKIAHAHTQFLKNIKGVIKEKGEILNPTGKNVIAYDLLKHYQSILNKSNTITFGYNPSADIVIANVKITQNGTTGNVNIKPIKKQITLNIPVYHKHIFENISAIIGTLIHANVYSDKLIKSIESFVPAQQRGSIEYYKLNKTLITFANYTYNANDASITNAIETIQDIKTNAQKILYIADILELGNQSQAVHKQIGKQLKKLNNTTIFLQGPLMKHAYNELKNKKHVFYSEDQGSLLKKLNNYIKSQSSVFIWAIGSLGMKTFNIVQDWKPIKK